MNKAILLLSLSVIAACDTTSKWKPSQDMINTPATQEEMSPYIKQINRHRDSTSAMFLSGANGILPKGDLTPTGKLNYFPANEDYKVKANFEPIENGEVIQMQTSTNEPRDYKRFGTLSFSLADADLQLTLYQNVEQPEYLFCPFKDRTNANTTYGAGRYLDFKIADLENPVLDFNYAYNPYCAYNSAFSCPIPPLENHLKVAILAGEKQWH